MKLKRFAAGFVAAVMALAVMGTPLGDILPFVRESVATTAGAETYGDYTYKVLDDGTVEITEYKGTASAVNIPDTIYGRKVTSIGFYAFQANEKVTSIFMPEGITNIEGSAFSSCTKLTEITISKSVTCIGFYAFANCTRLQSIIIPDGVQKIGDNTFSECKQLTNITIPKSVTSIGDYAFCGCKKLTSITIPESVTSIGDSAFFECISLTNMSIPHSVRCIGNYAFYKCTGLIDVTLSSGVTSIGACAFEECKRLTSIEIPNSVVKIGFGAFSHCSKLVTIEVDKHNSRYSSSQGILFNDDRTEILCYPAGKTDENYNIPDSVTNISNDAFSGCNNLKNVTIPDAVTIIGGNAFEDCTNLMKISIPNGVTNIESGTFCDCSNLENITIPDSIISIGKSAFFDCSSLIAVTIPNGVPKIDDSTFVGCRSLKNITIPDSVTSIENCAFAHCNMLSSVKISDSVNYIDDSAFYNCSTNFVLYGYANSEAEKFAKKKGYKFVRTGYSKPDVCTKSSYNIKIVDNNGNPIKNATISVDTISRKATGGFASISFPSAERIWKVSADKYVDKYISANELTADVNTIIMYPVGTAQKYHADKVYYSEKSDIDMVYTSGKINNYVNGFQATEVLTGTKTIDLVRKEYGVIKNYDFYLYCASDSNENATYEVYDGKKRLTTSGTKKIKLNTSMLNENSSLLIVEKFSDGSRNHYGVNLKAVDNKVSENSFELSTGSVSIAPSDDLSWLGSWNIDVPSFPLYAKCTGDEIRIGVGITKDVLDSDSKFFDYKDSFDKLKDSRKNASPLLKAKTLAELKSKYIKSNGKTKLPGLKDGFDLTIVGCGYAKIQPGQDTYTLGVNVIVTADYSVTLSHQFFVGVIPVTVNIKAGASVKGNFDMSWVKNGNSSGFANNTVLELTFEPYFKPYAGIGIDKVANVGVYGSLAMPIKITFMSPDKNAKGVNSVDIKGEAGLRANVMWFTYNYTIFKGSRNLYTKPQSMMTATIEQRIDVLNSIAYAAQSQREPIEEIFDIDNYDIVKESASAEFTNSNSGLIAGNMSQFSSSDILTSGDMTILATVNTDESRGINNQSYIVTSVYKDGKWSTPERINDSVYSELAPKLYKSGDDIFLIYQQATKEFTDDTANSEITDNIGIAVSKFNPDTMKFENTNMIYSKEGYSFAPKTDGNLAVWVNNGDGNPFGNTDNNSIVIYDGENVTELKTEIGNVLSADVGTLAGNSYIAYTVDKDGDLTTTDDIQLYITSFDGVKQILLRRVI